MLHGSMNKNLSTLAVPSEEQTPAAPDPEPSISLQPSVFARLSHWMRGLARARSHDGSLKEALEEALEEVIEEHSEQGYTLPQEEKKILRNVLGFGDIMVGDIMIPRTDIVAVPCDISLEDLKNHLLEQRHTRTPVYRDTLDHVEGFLHVKDMVPILSGDLAYDLKSVLRSMLFVPHSMKVINLLARMRFSGSHMAIVVDEHGGTDGLVTMEDLVEELVGEIHDEHDEEERHEEILRVSESAIDVKGRIRIDRLEQMLGLNLISEEHQDEFDTLGGLIFFHLGRVPTRGERVTLDTGVQLEIIEADARRISKVRIHLHKLSA